jgi:UrcA family protein
MKKITTTTSTRSIHPRSLVAAAMLTALISSFSAVCNAAPATDVPQAIVKYADLDISTSHGAAALYNRIRFAAESVCPALDHGDLGSVFRFKSCVQQAIVRAVTKVDQPALTAVYAAKYGVLQPANILTAQRR